MRPHGSPEELEKRRRRAIKMLQQGASVTEVARRIGCSHSSVILWRDAVRRRGANGLQAKPASGRAHKLVAWQVRRLLVPLLKGALAWGYTTDLWTTSRSRAIPPSLADLIERLKRENPHRTDTTLLRELALSSDPNSPPAPASTLYRFLQQRGRPTCARCGSQAPDSQDP